jgi:phospholipid/cholesterol/gamma-HCH transport system permease protein
MIHSFLKPLHQLGTFVLQLGQGLGGYLIFTYNATVQIFYPRFRGKLVVQQMEFIGAKSFMIVTLASFIVGAVFGIQFGDVFSLFGAESLIGAAASYTLSKELGPVLTSFLVAGRAGSAMTAEIATMKVNDQIDALRVSAVDPIGYLASPRLIASCLVMPILVGYFVFFGVLSSYLVSTALFDIDSGVFFEKIRWSNKSKNIIEGLQKAVLFGFLFSSVSCYLGFSTEGGAKGVGRSTTTAVVISLIFTLLLDFFVSYIQVTYL